MYYKKEKEETEKGGTLFLIAIGFLVGLVFGKSVCHKPSDINPRTLYGVDTLVTQDSLYPIHFTIDTAIENPSADETDDDSRY